MKTKENDVVVNILFGIIIVLILVILGILIFRGKKVDAKSDLVKELYSYTGSNDLSRCNGLINYTDKKVDYDTLDTESKICLAYSLLDGKKTDTLKIDTTKKNNNCSINENVVFSADTDEFNMCTVTRVKISDIKEMYQKIYNKELSDYPEFHLDNQTVCYYSDDNYYCGIYAGEIKITVGNEPQTYRSISKVLEKGSELVIYDRFVKIIGDKCYKYYTTEDINDKCTANLKDDTFKSDNDSKKQAKYLNKYGIEYKHVYEKVGYNYYWVSSEPLK